MFFVQFFACPRSVQAIRILPVILDEVQVFLCLFVRSVYPVPQNAPHVSPWYGAYKLSFTLKASFATETATIKIMRYMTPPAAASAH
jgi:hypothetical protein